MRLPTLQDPARITEGVSGRLSSSLAPYATPSDLPTRAALKPYSTSLQNLQQRFSNPTARAPPALPHPCLQPCYQGKGSHPGATLVVKLAQNPSLPAALQGPQLQVRYFPPRSLGTRPTMAAHSRRGTPPQRPRPRSSPVRHCRHCPEAVAQPLAQPHRHSWFRSS